MYCNKLHICNNNRICNYILARVVAIARGDGTETKSGYSSLFFLNLKQEARIKESLTKESYTFNLYILVSWIFMEVALEGGVKVLVILRMLFGLHPAAATRISNLAC